MIFKLQKIRDAEKENKTTQFKDTEGKRQIKSKDTEKDERCQGGKKLNQERDKDKNPMRLLLRNHASKESRLKYLKVERKNPLV